MSHTCSCAAPLHFHARHDEPSWWLRCSAMIARLAVSCSLQMLFSNTKRTGVKDCAEAEPIPNGARRHCVGECGTRVWPASSGSRSSGSRSSGSRSSGSRSSGSRSCAPSALVHVGEEGDDDDEHDDSSSNSISGSRVHVWWAVRCEIPVVLVVVFEAFVTKGTLPLSSGKSCSSSLETSLETSSDTKTSKARLLVRCVGLFSWAVVVLRDGFLFVEHVDGINRRACEGANYQDFRNVVQAVGWLDCLASVNWTRIGLCEGFDFAQSAPGVCF